MFDHTSLREAIIEGEVADAGGAARAALDAGASPLELIEQAVGPAMNEWGGSSRKVTASCRSS